MGFATFSAASSCVRPSFLICSGGSVNFLVCASMPDMIIVIFVITSSYWARLERSSLFAHGGCPHLNKGVPDRLHAFTCPSLVITGDQGAPAKRARDLVGGGLDVVNL